MKSSIALIGNPVSGRSSKRLLREIFLLIKSNVPSTKLFITEKPGDAERLSREALSLQPDLIVSAGGDGTCNEIINVIAGSSLPMAVIPLGTSNVLALELKIPFNLKDAVSKALTGTAHRVSLGHVQCEGKSRYFSLMAGVGYDANAVYGRGKRLSGKTAYIFSGIKKLFSWSPDELSIVVDGNPFRGYSLIVSNLSRYGGDFRIAPDADIKKPVLYAFIMHGKRKLDILRYATGIMRGRHLKLKDITYMPATYIDIKGFARIQVDGDYIGRTPAVIEAMPDSLSLVY